MGDRLATVDMGRKAGGWGCSPFRGSWVPHPTQCRLDRDLPRYQVASWSIQPFGHNIHGPKIGGCAPLGERGWVPTWHNVARPRPTSMPSFMSYQWWVRLLSVCCSSLMIAVVRLLYSGGFMKHWTRSRCFTDADYDQPTLIIGKSCESRSESRRLGLVWAKISNINT